MACLANSSPPTLCIGQRSNCEVVTNHSRLHRSVFCRGREHCTTGQTVRCLVQRTTSTLPRFIRNIRGSHYPRPPCQLKQTRLDSASIARRVFNRAGSQFKNQSCSPQSQRRHRGADESHERQHGRTTRKHSGQP